MAKRTKRTIAGYKTYLFRDKDPVVDEMRTLVQTEHGSVNGKALTFVHESSGVSVACLRAWFHGTTRRPQNASVEAVGRALGYRRQWTKLNGGGK